MTRRSEAHRRGRLFSGASAARGRRLSAAVALTLVGVAAQAGPGSTPAMATLTGPGVSAGKNITVFHNLDFVAVFGYGPVGTPITVDVIRAGVTIGTATGPSVDTPEGPGLEVNHGPEGTPQPGDCWDGTTPDIRPGDRVVVASGGVRNEVTVDNIRYTGQPAEDPTTGDIVVSGIAQRANGTNIAASFLDSGEFRNTTGKYRINPDVVEPTAGVPGGFTMRYRSPYTGERNRENLDESQRKQALLGNGHAIGFGHTATLPLESMLVDGIADVPGPALGCEGSPAGSTPPPVADTTAPSITSQAPAPGATQVSQDGSVAVGFSEPVTGLDGTTFTLTSATGSVPSGVSIDGTRRVATLRPNARLAAGATYTVALSGRVADTAGNPLLPASWRFTTVASAPAKDTVSPTVTSRTPANGASKISREVNVSVTFSEPVAGLTSTSMTLKSVKGGKSTSVPATVTYDPATRTGTLNPARTLDRNARYTAALTTGIVDLAGNGLTGASWSFTTRN